MKMKNKWKPANDLSLETNALSAATETKQCLMLTAGPGSGKTEVLAQRADFLLRTGACPYPKRILAISFKVDASKNLKNRVRCRCGSTFSARLDSYTFHSFAKQIIDRFRPELKGSYALDIDYQIRETAIARKQVRLEDLVPLAIEILNKSDIARRAIRLTYSDVFLDEFQDCTEEQYNLLKLAFQGTKIRLTAVGDEKQKIMTWAGALDGVFQTFIDDFSAKTLALYQNFRSAPRLLRMQNAIKKVFDPALFTNDTNPIREDGEIKILNFIDSKDEAKHLAKSIKYWIEQEHLEPSEIAILIRSQPNLYGEDLIKELEVMEVPYREEQKIQDLSTEPAARLIVDYLSVIYGQREPEAWTRLMNQITHFHDYDNTSQQESVNSMRNFVKDQIIILNSHKQKEDQSMNYRDFVRRFLNRVGIETLSSLSHDYRSKDRLRQIVKETGAFIEESLNRGHSLLEALQLFSDKIAVRVLTIHKSKGLEFDTVIILGVEQETFFNKNKKDELCAFFVGISRAKRRLILTVCEQRPKPSAATGRWDVHRTPHTEFLSYASPYLCKDQC